MHACGRATHALLLVHLWPPLPCCAGGAKPKTHILQDSADGFAAFLLVTLLPVSVYAATHLSVLFQWVHLWSLLLLATGPLVFITSLKGGWRACGSADGRGMQMARR